MEAADGPAAAAAPHAGQAVRAVTLAVGAGPGKTFRLLSGDVLRVGRGAKNDFVVDLDGISTCHLELFLRPVPGPAEEDATGAASAAIGLHARDTSKNGTGLRTSDPASGSSVWRPLPRGGLVRLEDGAELLLPHRGRPRGADEAAHQLRVRVAPAAAPAGPADEPGEEEDGVEELKAKAPKRRARKSRAADEVDGDPDGADVQKVWNLLQSQIDEGAASPRERRNGDDDGEHNGEEKRRRKRRRHKDVHAEPAGEAAEDAADAAASEGEAVKKRKKGKKKHRHEGNGNDGDDGGRSERRRAKEDGHRRSRERRHPREPR